MQNNRIIKKQLCVWLITVNYGRAEIILHVKTLICWHPQKVLTFFLWPYGMTEFLRVFTKLSWIFLSSLLSGTGWRPTLSSGMACHTWRMTFLPCTSVTTTASASKDTRTTRAIHLGPSARLSIESSCWFCITSPCSPYCFLSHWWGKLLERRFSSVDERGGTPTSLTDASHFL